MPAEPASPFLSPTQRRLAAFALTFLSLLGIIALLIGAVMMLGQLVGVFSGVIWPLAVAGVLALILRPVVELAEQRLRLRRTSAVVPLAFFQPGGGWQLLGLVLLVKTIVQLIESWVITPKVMGERTGLHPVTIIVAIFFWGTAFGGVLGMLLAIPLTAFFVTAWRLAKQKYFAAPHV